jgi:hypothetical protein
MPGAVLAGEFVPRWQMQQLYRQNTCNDGKEFGDISLFTIGAKYAQNDRSSDLTEFREFAQ